MLKKLGVVGRVALSLLTVYGLLAYGTRLRAQYCDWSNCCEVHTEHSSCQQASSVQPFDPTSNLNSVDSLCLGECKLWLKHLGTRYWLKCSVTGYRWTSDFDRTKASVALADRQQGLRSHPFGWTMTQVQCTTRQELVKRCHSLTCCCGPLERTE